MSVTASLISGSSPRLVQIVIDETPAGQSWQLVGAVGDGSGYTWTVPGGFGTGDGEQLVLVDNRAPGNTPVAYKLITEGGVESSLPVEVPFEKDLVLQSLDGQRAVQAELLDGSLSMDLATEVALFRVPGRSRPVSRYDVVADVAGSFEVLLPMTETTPFRALLGPGGPVVCRFGTEVADLDRVAVIQITRIRSTEAYSLEGLRIWTLEYQLVDDPFADVRLGAFSWDSGFDVAFEGRPWSHFDQAFSGLSWDAFDKSDWSVV